MACPSPAKGARVTAAEREALRRKIDEARRATIPKPEPGLIDFPPGSRAQHGTLTGRRHGCGCAECKEASNAARRKWRAANLDHEHATRRAIRLRKRVEKEQAA